MTSPDDRSSAGEPPAQAPDPQPELSPSADRPVEPNAAPAPGSAWPPPPAVQRPAEYGPGGNDGQYGGASAASGYPSYSGAGYEGAGYGGTGYGATGYGGTGYDTTGSGSGGYTGPGYDTTAFAPSYAGYTQAGQSGQSGQPGQPPQPSQPAKSRTGRTIGVAAAVALVVGILATAGTYAAMDHGSSTSSAGLSTSTQTAPAAKIDGTITAAAAAISPSVVTINVAAGGEGGTGSGIVIKTDGNTGYVLTNNHVVSLDSLTTAQSNTITVTLNNGTTLPATVVGTDPPDDLAVVKVTGSNLTAATFAKSSALTVGQTVVAMGAPLGLSNTVTSGIVSATARPVSTGSADSASIFNAIQTDAAINPGNSGGPLVDLNGHVVGVNSAIAGTGSGSGTDAQSGNIGIGFAIPSDEASRIAGELITTGKATHAILGITVSGQDQTTGPTSGNGATVAEVQGGSPAQKAGIVKGDVITKIGAQRIDDSVGAIAATRSYPPGTQVEVTLQSGGQTKTVSVTLGSSTDG